MNELLKTMSEDMVIKRYSGETEMSFVFRICYSALGMWCLKTACNKQNGLYGTSKNNQTQVLNTLLERFSLLYPKLEKMFIDENDATKKFAVMFRTVYEEIGYLLTDEKNNNVIARFGRGLKVGSGYLYFGYPDGQFSVNGLGVYTETAEQVCELDELLIRDSLTSKEYLAAYFNELDFTEREINIAELEFFNPLEKYEKISKSWKRTPTTKFSIARKGEQGPYYRIIQADDTTLIYADEQNSKVGTRLVDYEYRRIQFALRNEYNNPIVAKVQKVDEVYSSIYLPAHLPNREYYLFLLLGWPHSQYNVFDKSKFLFRSDFLSTIKPILNNLGIIVSVGGYYG